MRLGDFDAHSADGIVDFLEHLLLLLSTSNRITNVIQK